MNRTILTAAIAAVSSTTRNWLRPPIICGRRDDSPHQFGNAKIVVRALGNRLSPDDGRANG